MSTEEKTIAASIADYEKQEKDRKICRSLMGGTRSMREAGTEYLPKEAGEDGGEYATRLNRTFLLNVFRKTVKGLVAIAFRKPMEVKTSIPEVEKWSLNINRKGQTLEEFAKSCVRSAIAEGLTFVWVDYPTDVGEDVTLADERRLDLRPYFTQVAAEAVPYWRWEIWNGEPVLAEIRIKEKVQVQLDEFWHEDVDAIRRFRLNKFVLDNGTVERGVYWEQFVKDDKGNWYVLNDGVLDLDVIPIVPIYGDQTGQFTADPPLMDLAWLNVEHWQSQSDQRNILHFARVPFLFGAGLEDDSEEMTEAGGSETTLSVQRFMTSSNPAAHVGWIEVSGAGIEAGARDLDRLQEQMYAFGTKYLLSSETGNQTATQRILDKVEHDSELRSLVDDALTSLEAAFVIAGKYLGRDEFLVDLSLSASFEMILGSAADIPALIQFGQAIGAPPEFMLKEAVRWGFISPNIDIEALVAQLEEIEPEGNPNAGGTIVEAPVATPPEETEED